MIDRRATQRGSRNLIPWLGLFAGSILVSAILPQRLLGQGDRSGARGPAAPLARGVPRQDLWLYLEFDGLDSHADAWRKSAAFKLLNETKLGALLEDLCLQAIEVAQESVPAEKRLNGVDTVNLLKQIARDGFVLAASGKPPKDSRIVLVLHRGDKPELQRLLISLSARLTVELDDRPERRPIEKAGRTLNPLGSQSVWWLEKGDLIVTGQSCADEILEVLDGRKPSALDHPLRTALAKTEQDFQPAAVGFLDMAALGPLPSNLVGLGLEGLKRIELRWGFQGEALLGVLRVAAPEPRRGILALLDQPTFKKSALDRLPAGVTGFTLISIDLDKSYDQIDRLINRPDGSEKEGPANPDLLARRGLDLRRDLLAHVGPLIALYTQAPIREESSNAAELLASRAAGFTISAQLRNQAAVARTLDPFVQAIPVTIRQWRPLVRADQLVNILMAVNIRKLDGPMPRYAAMLPANTLLGPFATALSPTLVLSDGQFVLGASPAAAERALAAGPRWEPDGAWVPIIRQLPAEMVYLSTSDPRAGTPIVLTALPAVIRQINAEFALGERRLGKVPRDVYLRLDPEMIPQAGELDRWLFPSSTTLTVDPLGATFTHREAIPTITSPAVVATAAALVFPSIETAVQAARRARCANNLRQIVLAMHNYHAANNAFPRAAITGENGKPLLSWRVAILPYLQQNALYNKFKLDEPWDSPHNTALLKEMPSVFLCPDRIKPERFTTNYRVLVGPTAAFEPDGDTGVVDFTDGTSNTVLVAEAAEAVPWTKPDDLKFDRAAPPSLYGAGSPHAGGFNAAFADGTVHFIKNTIERLVFRHLVTRNGGEVVGAGSF